MPENTNTDKGKKDFDPNDALGIIVFSDNEIQYQNSLIDSAGKNLDEVEAEHDKRLKRLLEYVKTCLTTDDKEDKKAGFVHRAQQNHKEEEHMTTPAKNNIDIEGNSDGQQVPVDDVDAMVLKTIKQVIQGAGIFEAVDARVRDLEAKLKKMEEDAALKNSKLAELEVLREKQTRHADAFETIQVQLEKVLSGVSTVEELQQTVAELEKSEKARMAVVDGVLKRSSEVRELATQASLKADLKAKVTNGIFAELERHRKENSELKGKIDTVTSENAALNKELEDLLVLIKQLKPFKNQYMKLVEELKERGIDVITPDDQEWKDFYSGDWEKEVKS